MPDPAASPPPADPRAALAEHGRSQSPFHQPIDPASRDVAARAAADPGHPQNSSRRTISDTDFERLPHDQRDRYSRVRKVDSAEAEWAERDSLTAEPGEPGADGKATVKISEMELTEAELRQLMVDKAERESRRANVPADPSKYELTLPKEFVVPQGIEFKFADADPILGPIINEARAFAHEAGLDQAQFSKMMSLYAASKSHELSVLNTAREAEVAKLGVNATTRVNAIQVWLRGMVGDECARPMMSTLVTEKQVRGFERLMQAHSTQGTTIFKNSGRVPESTGVDDATYAGWTFSQKQNYARTGDPNKAAG
jgi:hypothetical protein